MKYLSFGGCHQFAPLHDLKDAQREQSEVPAGWVYRERIITDCSSVFKLHETPFLSSLVEKGGSYVDPR